MFILPRFRFDCVLEEIMAMQTALLTVLPCFNSHDSRECLHPLLDLHCTPAWEAGVLLNYEHLLCEQKVKGEERFCYSFQFNEMARPAGLEPAAFCLEDTQYKTLSAASGVAYEEALHLSRP